MQINPLSTYCQNNFSIGKYKTKSGGYSYFTPLIKDTVSFESMKKSQFSELDFSIVETFKAPIEKFNSLADYQKWAAKELQKIYTTEFEGRTPETKELRTEIIDKWYRHVTTNYTSAVSLLVISSLIKNLKSNNDSIPPILNEDVLKTTIDLMQKELKKDKKLRFNFENFYNYNLKNYYFELSNRKKESQWIKIPSQEHDSPNYQINVNKLKILSKKNWCTNALSAESYIADGDFYIYLENGETKLGISLKNGKISEIQGENNDGIFPIKYLDIIETLINEENLKLDMSNRVKFDKAKKLVRKINKIKTSLSSAIETNNQKKIFNYFSIKYTEEENNKITISEYKQPADDISYSDIGIDENKLFKNIKVITGNADFKHSQLESLYQLEKIEGDADFRKTKLSDIGNLKEVKGKVQIDTPHISQLLQQAGIIG